MDIQSIVDEVFLASGTGLQVQLFSARYPELSLDDAYRVVHAIRVKREGRGERPIGRKIGFTNRATWPKFNAHAPMWGYMYDSTVHDLPKAGADVALAGLVEPKIEPEIVFGLAAAPSPGMDEQTLMGCIEWVAHGCEIVQSIFPNWECLAADAIIGYGMHGASWIGPRHPLASRTKDWAHELSTFEIDLFQNGAHADHGLATNILDGQCSPCKVLSSCSPLTASIRRLPPERL